MSDRELDVMVALCFWGVMLGALTVWGILAYEIVSYVTA